MSWRQYARATVSAAMPRRFIIRGSRRSHCLYLTFDDGPHPENTPHLLDALAAWGVRATFFVIGEQVEKYPHLVRRMANEGHAVGDHTWSHSDIRKLSQRQFGDQLRKSRELLEDLTGRPIRLFRPPFGFMGVTQLGRLLWNGYSIALWNVDPKDCSGAAAEVRERLEGWTLQPGDVVLLHDDMPHVVESAELVVTRARSQYPLMEFNSL